MTNFEKYQHYRSEGGRMSFDEWLEYEKRYISATRIARSIVVGAFLALLLLALLSSCRTQKTGCEWKKPRRAVYQGFMTLRVMQVKNGYTYAFGRGFIFRAKLDTVLHPGDSIRATWCPAGSNPNTFYRIR